jgi:hypothetical protein
MTHFFRFRIRTKYVKFYHSLLYSRSAQMYCGTKLSGKTWRERAELRARLLVAMSRKSRR